MVGIEEASFLDILLEGQNNPQRVIYNRGDILFVRNDIPHRGCKCIGDYTHHRVHVLTLHRNYVEDKGSKTQIPFYGFPNPPDWCLVEEKFISSFN